MALKVEENVSLKPFNTFGIDVKTRWFTRWETVDDIREYISDSRFEGVPLLILGGGSNVLFLDDFEGLTALNEIKGIEVTDEDDETITVRAGGGVQWHDLVMWSVQKGYGGLENLSLIPGKVGAAPMQNIGAYGVELKDVMHSLEAIDLTSGEIRQFSNAECEFGYRTSVFKTSLKGRYVIVSVTLILSKNPVLNTSYGAIEQELKSAGVRNPGVKDVSGAVIRIRRSKLPDPAELGNSGSFFKNPVIAKVQYGRLKTAHPEMPGYPVSNDEVKVPAGWLIDRAGWKGKRFGNCGVHKNQALVLVNYGEATGREIFDLSERIIEDIEEKYGVRLEREVNVIG